MNRQHLDKERTLSQANQAVVKRIRKRRGQCVTCGTNLYGVRVDPANGVEEKAPLTIDGKVLNGRCLTCRPLSNDPLQQPPVSVAVTQTKQATPKRNVRQSEKKETTRSASLRSPQQSKKNLASFSPSGHYATSSPNAESRGESAVSSASGVTLQRIRERQGLCGECGRQTHSFVIDKESGIQIKEPLEVDGEVHRGRCLRCHPLPNNQISPTLRSNDMTTGEKSSSMSSSLHDSAPGNKKSSSDDENTPPKQPRSILRRASSYNSAANSSASEPRSILRRTSSYNSAANSSASGAISSSKSTHHFLEGLDISPKDEKAAADRLSAMDARTADLCDVIATMRTYPKNTRIQELGCCKLWAQSQDEGKASAIGYMGGIPTILDAMRSHLHSEYLNQMGCNMLENLASSEHNGKLIVEKGGFDVLCDAMTQHQEDMGVQAGGCAAFSALAEFRQYCKNLDMERTLGALIGAVAAFPEDQHVLRFAFDALKAFGYKPMKVLLQWQDDEGRKKLVGARGA